MITKLLIILAVIHILPSCGNDQLTKNIAGLVFQSTKAPSEKELAEMIKSSQDFTTPEARIDVPGVGGSGSSNPRVNTTSGEVEGITEDGAHAFYEIPYAEPPIGELRYQPPIPVQDRKSIDATSSTGIQCHQLESECLIPNDPRCRRIRMDEDCLFLNVFTPADLDLSDPSILPNSGLPVLFYIHGGAFTGGRGTSDSLNGKELAVTTNMVVVPVNYRLGALGFLVHKEEGQPDLEGNQGFKDQQLALQWVQDNIARFGGDPGRVTLSGNSAGAQSVMFHTLSKLSSPMYNNAVQQSNPAVFSYDTPNESLKVTDYLLKSLRCDSSLSERECLMTADPTTISSRQLPVQIRALTNRDTMAFIEPYRPVIDGIEFTDSPMYLFRDGKWNSDKDMIIGVETEEIDDIQYYLPAGLEYNKFLFAAVNYVIFGIGTTDIVVNKYAEEYPPGEGENWMTTFGKEITHLYFVCPSRAMARYASATSSAKVYFYADEHPVLSGSCYARTNDTEGCYFASHASEVRFLFRTVSNPDIDDTLVENQMSTYWGSFARTGSPSYGLEESLGKFTDWPQYKLEVTSSGRKSDKKSNVQILAETLPLWYRNVNSSSGDPPTTAPWQNIRIKAPNSDIEEGYEQDICDFWDSIGYYMDPIPLPSTTTTKSDVTTTTTAADAPTTSRTDNHTSSKMLCLSATLFLLSLLQ